MQTSMWGSMLDPLKKLQLHTLRLQFIQNTCLWSRKAPHHWLDLKDYKFLFISPFMLEPGGQLA